MLVSYQRIFRCLLQKLFHKLSVKQNCEQNFVVLSSKIFASKKIRMLAFCLPLFPTSSHIVYPVFFHLKISSKKISFCGNYLSAAPKSVTSQFNFCKEELIFFSTQTRILLIYIYIYIYLLLKVIPCAKFPNELVLTEEYNFSFYSAQPLQDCFLQAVEGSLADSIYLSLRDKRLQKNSAIPAQSANSFQHTIM